MPPLISVSKMSLICSSCRQPKSSQGYHCGVCQRSLCKNCAQFLDDSFFSFLKNIPEELKYASYCAPCYDQIVAPAKESYLRVMKRAKGFYVFYKKDKKVPVESRARFKVSVENCSDRKETILRLAFLAADEPYNAVIEVDVVSKKIRNYGYQKLSWSGTAFPAQIRVSQLEENN